MSTLICYGSIFRRMILLVDCKRKKLSAPSFWSFGNLTYLSSGFIVKNIKVCECSKGSWIASLWKREDMVFVEIALQCTIFPLSATLESQTENLWIITKANLNSWTYTICMYVCMYVNILYIYFSSHQQTEGHM